MPLINLSFLVPSTSGLGRDGWQVLCWLCIMMAIASRDTATPELCPGFSAHTMNFTNCPKLSQTSATFNSFSTCAKLDLSVPAQIDSRTAIDSLLAHNSKPRTRGRLAYLLRPFRMPRHRLSNTSYSSQNLDGVATQQKGF